MILCITPNAAVDRTLIVPGFDAEGIFRPTDKIIAAGGKGVNVARAFRSLGGQAVCAGFIGGHSGRWVAELAEQEGLPGVWTQVGGESRTCTIIVNPDNFQVSVVNERGTTVTDDDWERLQADVMRAVQPVESVCICGSLPSGSPSEAFVNLLQSLHKTGKDVWVDTSGDSLRTALTVKDIGVKVNDEEAGTILGKNIADLKSAADAAIELRQRGPRTVVLTLGALGAVMSTETGQWHVQSPTIQVKSTVGSGDSFLAGLIKGFTEDKSPPEALRQAVAVGLANALSVGGGLFKQDDFNRALSQTVLREL